jgi:hypothetical protein
MKVASLIVALGLALASGSPAQPAQPGPVAGAVVAVAVSAAIQPIADTTDPTAASAEPGPSTYVLLALGLFGMGLVSRRRQAD